MFYFPVVVNFLKSSCLFTHTLSKEKSPEPKKNTLECSAFEKQNILLSEMKRERVFEPQM